MPETDLPTSERLARDLEAAGDPRLASIIEKARSGNYDLVDRFILVDDLLEAGHPELAESVWNGFVGRSLRRIHYRSLR